MYLKEVYVLFMFFGTLNAVSRSGFYLHDKAQSNSTVIECLNGHKMKSVTAKVVKDGVICPKSLDFLKSAYEENLQIFAVVEFGRREDNMDFKKQFSTLIKEVDNRNMAPMLFISVRSLRTGIIRTESNSAEQLFNEIIAAAKASGLEIGLQSSKHDYQKIFGNITLEFPLMHDKVTDGPFVPFASFQKPDIEIYSDDGVDCGFYVQGRTYFSTIVQNIKASKRSSVKLSLSKKLN